MDLTEFWRVLKQVKRLSSWLDEVSVEKPYITSVLHFGGAVASTTALPIPEASDEMKWLDTLRTGGTMALHSVLPVPERA